RHPDANRFSLWRRCVRLGVEAITICVESVWRPAHGPGKWKRRTPKSLFHDIGSGSCPQPNPFGSVSTAATTTTTTAPPVKNPFQQASSQTTAPSIFGAKATTGFGALSQPQANRSPSPFSVPSNQ
ncbi:unnamed protein product, partial [Parascedosporium putredinis]